MGVPKVYIDLACGIHDSQSFWWEKILEYSRALEDHKVHHWSNIWSTKCPSGSSDPYLGLVQLPDYLPWHLILDSALSDNASLHNLEWPHFGFPSPQKLFLLNHWRCDTFTVDFNIPFQWVFYECSSHNHASTLCLTESYARPWHLFLCSRWARAEAYICAIDRTSRCRFLVRNIWPLYCHIHFCWPVLDRWPSFRG